MWARVLRGLAAPFAAYVAGLCLLIAAHLDTAERRIELATLVAIGASRWTVLGAGRGGRRRRRRPGGAALAAVARDPVGDLQGG